MYYGEKILLGEGEKSFFVTGMRGGGRVWRGCLRLCELIRRFSNMKVYMNSVGLLIKYNSLSAAEMEQLDIVARKYCHDNSLTIVVRGDKYHITGPAAGLYEILYRLSNVCDIEIV